MTEQFNEDDNIPLTKPKRVKQIFEKHIVVDPDIEINKEIVKVIKPKRQMSEKQKENFKLLQEKRMKSIENKKLEKKIEASKLLLQHNITKDNITKVKKEPKYVYESSSDDEPEIIYVKKNKSTKSKKKIIVEESDTEDEYEEPINKVKKSWGSSQQNKKSVVKVNTPQYTNKDNYRSNFNIFCD